MVHYGCPVHDGAGCLFRRNPPRIMSSVARRITGAPKRRDREVRNGKDAEGAHRGGNPSSSGSSGLERPHEAKVTSSDDSK